MTLTDLKDYTESAGFEILDLIPWHFKQDLASASEWAFQSLRPAFHPNTFIDISDTLETKIEAMKIYESESRSFPHPRSAKALISNARRWGSVAGIEAAEPFELIREVR